MGRLFRIAAAAATTIVFSPTQAQMPENMPAQPIAHIDDDTGSDSSRFLACISHAVAHGIKWDLPEAYIRIDGPNIKAAISHDNLLIMEAVTFHDLPPNRIQATLTVATEPTSPHNRFPNPKDVPTISVSEIIKFAEGKPVVPPEISKPSGKGYDIAETRGWMTELLVVVKNAAGDGADLAKAGAKCEAEKPPPSDGPDEPRRSKPVFPPSLDHFPI